MRLSTEQLVDELQKPVYKEEPLDAWLNLHPVKVNYIFYFENGLICTLNENNEFDESWSIIEFLTEFQDQFWIIN